MGVIAENDQKLNDALNNGTLLEVFRDIYHPDVVMKDRGESWAGLDTNFEREKAFFGSITEFRGGGCRDAAVDEEAGVSYNTQWFDVTLANGYVINMTEIAVRKWKDGKIIEEEFFYPGQAG